MNFHCSWVKFAIRFGKYPHKFAMVSSFPPSMQFIWLRLKLWELLIVVNILASFCVQTIRMPFETQLAHTHKSSAVRAWACIAFQSNIFSGSNPYGYKQPLPDRIEFLKLGFLVSFLHPRHSWYGHIALFWIFILCVWLTITQSGYLRCWLTALSIVLKLSLIHISEPTRPY